MTEKRSKADSMIRMVAVAAILGLCTILVLGLGGFGLRLLLAMRTKPNPNLESRIQPAPPPLGSSVAPPPAQAQPGDPQQVHPAEGLPAAPAAAADPQTLKLIEVGKGVFVQCGACHGPDGKPPIPNMAPTLAGSPIANGPSERVAALVLNGVVPEGRFQGVMVPWKAMLTDEQIAGVITFIRSHFGNKAPPVTPDMVAYARKKYAGQANPMKRADIEAITAELPRNPG